MGTGDRGGLFPLRCGGHGLWPWNQSPHPPGLDRVAGYLSPPLGEGSFGLGSPGLHRLRVSAAGVVGVTSLDNRAVFCLPSSSALHRCRVVTHGDASGNTHSAGEHPGWTYTGGLHILDGGMQVSRWWLLMQKGLATLLNRLPVLGMNGISLPVRHGQYRFHCPMVHQANNQLWASQWLPTMPGQPRWSCGPV